MNAAVQTLRAALPVVANRVKFEFDNRAHTHYVLRSVVAVEETDAHTELVTGITDTAETTWTVGLGSTVVHLDGDMFEVSRRSRKQQCRAVAVRGGELILRLVPTTD
jgi:hypothetical protein